VQRVPESWQICGARETDAAEIARLAGLLGYPSGAQAMHERLGELLARPDQHIAVVALLSAPDRRADGARLGGWVHVARHITLESGEFAEILGLIVDPATRRAGVGRALVAETERWARVHQLARLIVRSNVLRGESHSFYPALGLPRSKSQHVYAKSLGADIGAVA
jgi:GNAT superfamily N-acetyltransferase